MLAPLIPEEDTMSKQSRQGQKQYSFPCPKTGKPLSCSKEVRQAISDTYESHLLKCLTTGKHIPTSEKVYNTLQRAQEQTQVQQESMSNQLKSLMGKVAGQFYSSKHKTVKAKFKFTEEGLINISCPQLRIECKEEIRTEVEYHCTNLVKAINYMLMERNDEIKEESHNKVKQLSQCA